VLKKIGIIVRELGHLTPMAFLVLFLPMLGSALLLIFISPIGEWLRANGALGAAVFVAGMILACGFSLLPTNVIGLVSGWAFGFWAGLALLMAGIVGAALVSFFISSRISGRRLPAAASKHVRTEAIYNALIHEKFWRTTLIVFLLRAALVPFAFTNFLLASARTSVSAYVIGTFTGMLPRSAAMVFAGAGVSHLDPENTRDILTLLLVLAGTVAAVVIIAIFSRKALKRLVEDRSENTSGSLIDAPPNNI
jgi:uncharacterized membrane protein YdjX (TVP38/TMEM64 family)